MADYLIDLDFVASEYEDGEYQEFGVDEGSLATIPTGTGPTVRPYENAGTPATAITIFTGDRIQFRWDRVSRTGDHTVTIVAYVGTSSSGTDSKTLFGAASNTTLFNGVSIEGTGAYLSGYYTAYASATSNYRITITYTSTRGDGQSYTRTIYFNATAPVVLPDTDISTSWPIGAIDSSATSFLVGIGDGSAVTTYQIRTGSYSGTVVGSRKGNGNITVSDTPDAGSSKLYYLTATVLSGDGGDGSVSSISMNTVFKASAGSGDPVDGGTGTYGVEIFDSSGTKTMSIGDTLGFIVGAGTITVPRNSNGTIDLTIPGAKTTNTAVCVDLTAFAYHALNITIPSANTVRTQYTVVENPISGTATYTIAVINLGD